MMKLLVLNAGSSSLKYQLIDLRYHDVLLKGHVDGIGRDSCQVSYEMRSEQFFRKTPVKTHLQAVKLALATVAKRIPLSDIAAVGHRVVHGGEQYKTSVKIDANVIRTIDKLSELAPLHNPHNLAGIKACKKLLARIPQVAVFDTAFHQTIPKRAYLYGIPYEYYKKYKIRKYGFHGTSHKYVMLKAKKLLNVSKANLITCHLGNGASITAIKNNKSVDTSMGFTPLQGLMMGTRSGDIDPTIIAFLARKEKKTVDEILTILNKESGLKGIDGIADVRTIHEKALSGDKHCRLALEMFAYRVYEYIGAYMAVLGEVDAIVFTGGIGEGAYYLRSLICKHLQFFGLRLNEKSNKKGETTISRSSSNIKAFVIPTNEELMIAKETKSVLKLK